MIRFFTLFAFLISVSVSSAQPGFRYSIDDKKAIGYFEEAIRTYELGLVDESIELLSRAIDRSPEFGEAYLLKAQISSDRGHFDAAMADLEKVTNMNPRKFPDAFFFLGELRMRAENYDLAEKAFLSFKEYGSQNENLSKRATLMIASSQFAARAIHSPVPFEPKNMGPMVNTEDAEYFPCLTADGKTLLFTRLVSDNRVKGGKQEDFYVAQKIANQWELATPVSEINTVFNEGAPTISADGQILFFTACEAAGGQWGPYEGMASCDLFLSRKVGGHWGKAQNVKAVNSFNWDSQPSFSADGRTLYFVRGKTGPNGIQEQDIYFSEIQVDGAWSKPARIPGKVNTVFEEESVMIHPDGETLYFSSNGHAGFGGLDIFMSKKQADGTWGEPRNLGYPINTGGDENSLLVSADGVLAYFASDRKGGFGDLDMYQFELPKEVRPNAVTYLAGNVFDAKSFKKLEARFELIDLSTGLVAIESYSDAETGTFLVCLPPNRDYALNVSRPGYLFYSDHFSLIAQDASTPFTLEIPLEKLKPGSKVVLNNVFFDTDSYVLKPESQSELDRLKSLLDTNAGLRIEISGHTDDVGSDTANQTLSENRAAAVVEYLVSKGIDKARLISKGYGESKPIASNGTEAGRAMNRRTEIEIL